MGRRGYVREVLDDGGGVQGLTFGEDVLGYATEFANDAEPGENLQGVIGDVDFPPVEALARGSHEVVMVVVPTFAESDEREEPIVFAGVGGREAALAEDVRERIDGEGTMPEENGAQEEAPEKHSPPADQPERNREDRRRDEIVFVEPAQFREFGEVADVVEARFVVPVGENPPDVRPPETEERGRVKIFFLIGVAVVVTVMRGPPQNALLRGGHGHPGNDELEPTAGLEGAVRKITVIASRDEEHAHLIEEDAREYIGPLERHKENTQSREVNKDKGDRRNDSQPRPVGQGDSQRPCH